MGRFLAKVDMAKSTSPPPTCPVPSSLAIAPQCFHYGYVEYAFPCATGLWGSALALWPGGDDLHHRPVCSSVLGGFHPAETHAIVAPDTAANPFVPVPLFPTGGIPAAEAAWVLEGVVRYRDACSPTGVVTDNADIASGAITGRGYVTLPNPVSPVPQRFVDLASNDSHVVGPSPIFPICGAVAPTGHVTYLSY